MSDDFDCCYMKYVCLPKGKTKRWKRKRTETFLNYLLLWFSIGMQFTIIYSTLWTYLNTGIQSTRPNLHYGLISAGTFTCMTFLGLPVSKWFDTHRKLRLLTILINLTMAVGYCLYMVPTSPYFAFVGSILYGSCFILRASMNSEIFRVYECEDIQGQYLIGLFAYGIGEIVGPICVKLSENVNFSIYGMHFSVGNIPILILLGLTFLRLILAFCCVHDVSREHDLKMQTTSTAASEETAKIHEVAKSIDVYFVLFQQFLSTAIGSALFPLFIPLLVETLKYDNLATYLCFIGASAIMVLFSILAWAFNISSVGVYYCGVLSLVLIIVAYLVCTVLISVKTLSNAMCILLLMVFVIAYAVSWVCEMTFTTITIGKLHRSSEQCFAESLRMITRFSGALIGALISPFAFQYYNCLPVFALMMIFLLVCLFVRKESLIDPQVLYTEVPLVPATNTRKR